MPVVVATSNRLFIWNQLRVTEYREHKTGFLCAGTSNINYWTLCILCEPFHPCVYCIEPLYQDCVAYKNERGHTLKCLALIIILSEKGASQITKVSQVLLIKPDECAWPDCVCGICLNKRLCESHALEKNLIISTFTGKRLLFEISSASNTHCSVCVCLCKLHLNRLVY